MLIKAFREAVMQHKFLWVQLAQGKPLDLLKNCVHIYSVCLMFYVLLHQASEWGMRGLQGSFPQCKKSLPRCLEK
jgi:hypothetical protein